MTTVDHDETAAAPPGRRRTQPGLVEHVLERSGVGAGSAVLEVGCGTADHLAAIRARTGARCVGVEPSQDLLAVARAQPVELELHEGRPEDLDLPADTFDLVLSVDVVHHVRRPAEYFASARRVLKPGGLLCTVTASDYVIRNRRPLAEFFPATVDVDLGRYHDIPHLRAALEATGYVDHAEQLIESDDPVTDAAPYATRAYPSLHLVPDDEFRRGLAALEAALARGPVPGVRRSHVVWGRRPA